MERGLFVETIKMLFKMASVNFIKATVETGYMENFYENKHYADLESSIDRLSQDLIRKVFNYSATISVA